MNSLGARIRSARIASGLSQEDIADAMRRTRSAVSLWEKGYSTPTTENLRTLAEVLKVNPEYLSNGKGKPPIKIKISHNHGYRRTIMTRFQRLIATGKFDHLLHDYIRKRISSGQLDKLLASRGYRKRKII